MRANSLAKRSMIVPALLAVLTPTFASKQASPPDSALVGRTLLNELRQAQDAHHPMRYQLRKASPRLTTTKIILETRDGGVARLTALNDRPLNVQDEQKEQARLEGLLRDPGKQRHRKQAEDVDLARVLRVLQALPEAFSYQAAGPCLPATGRCERFTFHPNPNFDPADLETQALTEMSGELWIDPGAERVLRLEGHLGRDVDFGWGILGRLYKGGWIVIQQADIGGGQWRIVRFQMSMNGRVFFKTRNFDTIEEESGFAPLPAGLDYARAIQILLNQPAEHGEQ